MECFIPLTPQQLANNDIHSFIYTLTFKKVHKTKLPAEKRLCILGKNPVVCVFQMLVWCTGEETERESLSDTAHWEPETSPGNKPVIPFIL